MQSENDLDFVRGERMALETAFQDFLDAHQVGNSSPNTIESYRRILRTFVDWLQNAHKLTYVDQLRIKHLRGYVLYLQKRPSERGPALSDTTIHHYALVVSVFCHWLEHEELIEKSVVDHFDLPKFEQREIPALTREDLQKLLDACDEGYKKRSRLRKALASRNRAMISLLFDAGIRRSELIGLRLGDIDRDLRLLHIRRKGGKWQQVPVSYDGFKLLHEYLTKYRSYLASLGGIGSKKDDPVFIGSRGEPLDARGLSAVFERLRERAGITDKPVYSHQGRRFMATTQLGAGRNPLDVQRQMGHTTLMMTNRYYSQTVEGLKESHEEYSPLRKRGKETKSSGLGSGYYEE